MAKRLAIMVGMMVLATAVPAFAQEAVSEDRTLYFELTVEGEPPAGATFSALAPGANITELADPDGDGVYTGSLTAPGGNYPRCVPVEVFGKNSPNEVSYEIRYEHRFCFEDGDVFSASYSFAEGEGTTTTGDGGSPSAGSGQYGLGSTVVSDDINNANKGGVSVDADDGSEQGAVPSAAKALPATGGILPVAAAAGALLIAGGLVTRRIFR